MLRLLRNALLILVVLLAALVASVWAPDRSVAALSARWAPPPSTFIPVLDLRVHLRDEGPRDDSLPILLLHGTSSSLHTWDGWTRDLVRDHRVVRVDLPAFGLTGPFPDGDYTTAHYQRFLVALLDSLHVPRAIVAGNSFGGQLAWQLALVAPTRVAAIALVDAAGYPIQSLSVPIGFRLARNPAMSGLMTHILPRSVVSSSVRNTYGDPALVTDSTIDRYYELTLREGNRAALPLRFRSVEDTTLRARMSGITVPTLIIWGLRDRLIPPDHAERFHRDIKQSAVVTYDNLGHIPMEEDPARTVAAFRAFVVQHFPPAKTAP
jgi:pimeloyl-ACP methyl ester carboxylesterase